MEEIMIYGITFAVGIAIFFGTKWAAARFGGANEGVARAAFDELDGFGAGPVQAYLGSAIGYDETTRRIAIWEKKGGARLVDPNGVSEWHSGVLLTQVAHRTTATPMIQLYSRASHKPFFKVGVVDKRVCEDWREYLSASFGAKKEREGDFRALGM
jgi:hypothetical protein